MRTLTLSVLARIVAAGLLLWALNRHPYSYYVLLRWITCAVALYSTLLAVGIDKKGWAWALGVTAGLFNPLFPVHLDRSTWAVVDAIAAALLLASIYFVRDTTPRERVVSPRG